MGKRGNDNSQLSKEEYDALESRGGSSPAANGDFDKASSSVLGRRKIVRSASKWKAAKAGSSASPGGGSSNPFASVSLTKSTATSAAPAIAGKPAFAMPSLPMYTSIAPKVASKVSFGSSPTPSSTSSNGQLDELRRSFRAYIRNADDRLVWRLPMCRFVTTSLKLTKGEDKEQKMEESDSSSKPLFPPVTGAPAPVDFTFGSTSAPAPSSSSKPAFAFTAAPVAPATAPTATSGFSFAAPKASSPAPASSSGFQFSVASTPAPPVAQVATTASTAPTGAEESGEKEEESVLESADDGWSEVLAVKVKAFHHRADKATKFAMGMLKLQKHKEDDKNRRMVMRDAAGSVLVNLGISRDMTFEKSVTQTAGGKKPVARIVFYGLRAEAEKPEMFTLICKNDELDSFHLKLEELTK